MKPATLVAAALCVASVAAFAPKASGAALMSARSQRVAPPAMSMEVWSEKNIRLTLPLGVALPLAGLVTPPDSLVRRVGAPRRDRRAVDLHLRSPAQGRRAAGRVRFLRCSSKNVWSSPAFPSLVVRRSARRAPAAEGVLVGVAWSIAPAPCLPRTALRQPGPWL